MKRIVLVLLAMVLLCGCSQGVNSSPEDVIKGYMNSLVKKDEALLKQCLDDDQYANDLLEANQYNDYQSLGIQSISNEGNVSLYAYTGVLSYGDGLTVPYLNTVKVIEIDKLYYIVADSISHYSDLAIEQLNALKKSEIYQTYSEKVQAFLSQENLGQLFKKAEDFKNSEEYARYMEELSKLMESKEYQNLVTGIKEIPNSETFQAIQNSFKQFLESDDYKNIQSQLQNIVNSEEMKQLYDKISQYFK